MWVVKLGGSLFNTCDLPSILKTLADHGAGNVVIVPGGGVFADQVRHIQKELQIDDMTAHRMALRAMEQSGAVITSLDPRFHAANNIETINEWLDKNEIPVWFPYDMVADNPSIKAGWEITSDSLSLWLAQAMHCQDLVLLKATVPENENYSAAFLSESGYLDHAFASMLTEMVVKPWWLFYKQMEIFINLLDGRSDATALMKQIT